MNRRKPKVVIPSNVDQLLATSVRVLTALNDGSSIIEGNANVIGDVIAAELGVANPALAAAIPLVVLSNEASQASTENRNVDFEALLDTLIQVRDFAIAISDGNRSSIGAFGFEVVQSTSTSGNSRVLIPRNPESFIALSNRVLAAVNASGNATLAPMVANMQALIDSARQSQNDSVMKREEWQRLVADRDAKAETVRNLLRRARDLAFAVAGPRNYETVSTLGFVVQSNATQNGSGSGSSSSSSSAEPSDPDTRLIDDLYSSVNTLFGDVPEEFAVPSGTQVTLDEWRLIYTEEFNDEPGGLAEADAAWQAVD